MNERLKRPAPPVLSDTPKTRGWTRLRELAGQRVRVIGEASRAASEQAQSAVRLASARRADAAARADALRVGAKDPGPAEETKAEAFNKDIVARRLAARDALAQIERDVIAAIEEHRDELANDVAELLAVEHDAVDALVRGIRAEADRVKERSNWEAFIANPTGAFRESKRVGLLGELERIAHELAELKPTVRVRLPPERERVTLSGALEKKEAWKDRAHERSPKRTRVLNRAKEPAKRGGA
jgi:hypothetical protein